MSMKFPINLATQPSRKDRPILVASGAAGILLVATLVVLVYGLTRSASLAAALTAVRLLPYVLGLPLGGLLADRLDR